MGKPQLSQCQATLPGLLSRKCQLCRSRNPAVIAIIAAEMLCVTQLLLQRAVCLHACSTKMVSCHG